MKRAWRSIVVAGLFATMIAALQGGIAFAEGEGGSGTIEGYTPDVGFKLAETAAGNVHLRIYTYIRYLNQQGLDATYTDASGQTFNLDRRQDLQFNKVNIQFHGWLMSPQFRYLAYVWTSNTSQGLGAQVVVGGNLNYTFNRHVTLGGGIGSLPGTRKTEGNFPFWLTVDNRLMAEEFFRPSYTTGVWASGNVIDKLKYHVMLGNNLSQLGVDAGQLDDNFNTFSAVLKWFPTTGEFGAHGSLGDFDAHQDVATRLAAHFTRSDETRQGQPDTEAYENSQIRLSDGTVIFRPGALGEGTLIDAARYHMLCLDGGAKFRGVSLEGAYFWRVVDHFSGRGVETFTFDSLDDNGFELQASGMVVPKTLQLYAGGAKIFGEYGEPWEVRAGANWTPWKNQVVRCNLEYLHTDESPVGGLSLPYAVGGTGDIVHLNVQVNF